MSIIRKFDQFNEECVVAFSSEGDERLHMPLCGITRCLPGYRIRRNISREYVFEISSAGKESTGRENRCFIRRRTTFISAHAGSMHEYHTDNSDCWEKIWFNVQGSLAAELMHSYRLDDVYYLHESGLHDLFAESLACMRKNLENAHEAATMTVHRLIYHISRQYHGAGTGKESSGFGNETVDGPKNLRSGQPRRNEPALRVLRLADDPDLSAGV
ncbi:MAG: AraC family ligand binding domain-containing protein [Victivallales bacterium]